MKLVPKTVIDASALVALLKGEPGAEIVKAHLKNALLSTVNLYETATVLARYGITVAETRGDIESIIPKIIPYSSQHACRAADLYQQTRTQGLSLGDCACLAVAQCERAVALTADRIWKETEPIINIEIIAIR